MCLIDMHLPHVATFSWMSPTSKTEGWPPAQHQKLICNMPGSQRQGQEGFRNVVLSLLRW